MLILTRRVGEEINIGPEDNPRLVRIRILGFAGSTIRIGIEAPTNLVIDRDEITERKSHEPKTKNS